MSREFTHTDSGSHVQTTADDPELLYESPNPQSVAMGDTGGSRVTVGEQISEDNSPEDILRSVRTVDGQEMRVSPKAEAAIRKGQRQRPDERVNSYADVEVDTDVRDAVRAFLDDNPDAEPALYRLAVNGPDTFDIREVDLSGDSLKALAKAGVIVKADDGFAQFADRNGVLAGLHALDLGSYSMATVERINGEQDEMERQYAVAHRAEQAEHDRAAACRDEVSEETYYQRTTGDTTADVSLSERDKRPDLDQDDLALVNQLADKLADSIDGLSLGRPGIAKLLASAVADGSDPRTAALNLKSGLERTFPTVVQPIADIDPFEQYETTVVGDIKVLWEPKSASQHQVGLIEDESGEAVKLTVWKRAGSKPTLKEGDRVRVTRAKVNAYNGASGWETTLAVDAEADIHHLDHGDGPATRRATFDTEPTRATWDTESDQHEWVGRLGGRDRNVAISGGQFELETDEIEVGRRDGEGTKTVEVMDLVDGPEITAEREGRPPLEGESMEEFRAELDELFSTIGETACPECDSTNTSSYQQQTGAADEGMTSFNKCADCGHSWRGGYGG